MSNIPSDLKYTADHEWVRVEADGSVTVGITDHAQTTLGDLVFVELPAVGKAFKGGDAIGVVESVKAASDVFNPVAGEVLAINQDLIDTPELGNEDPYGDGWFLKIKPANAADLNGLLTAQAYAKEIGE